MSSSSTPQPISLKTSARKLPIKRKSPDLSNFNPSPSPNFIPKIKPETYEDDDDDEESLDDLKPAPPFKFHRIWTESDEIRFLQGLLDCSSEGLVFPRDLHLFYLRFSNTMSQPYSKSQLSEKLRRLRKKFRVISSRISHGLDPALLSEHDQALMELSKKLWDPNFNSESPFNVNNNAVKKKNNASVSVKVSFNPTFTPSPTSSIPVPAIRDEEDDCEVEISDKSEKFDDGNREQDLDLNLKNVGNNGNRNANGVETRRIVLKTIMGVLDKSLEEVKMGMIKNDVHCEDHKLSSSHQSKVHELMKRCQEQRQAELEVLARRVRLVLDNSIGD